MRIDKICLEEQFNYDDVSESELKIIFEKRLEEAKEKSVFEPFCTPYNHSNFKEDIILNDEVVHNNYFTFKRYSESKLVEYALKHRNNIQLHINSMSNLWLNEYPAPNESGRIFMVSTNGRHRSLVFKCLGLKFIEANIQYLNKKRGSWRYWFDEPNSFMIKLLNWMVFNKRIEVEYLDSKNYLITDSSNLIPWILPNSKIFKPSDIRKDILKRLNLVEKSFGKQDFDDGSIRKSFLLWYIDVLRVNFIMYLKKDNLY